MNGSKVKSVIVLKVFWRYARKQWLLLSVIMTSIVVAESVAVISPTYYKEFFDVLASDSADMPVLLGIVGSLLVIRLVGWLAYRAAGFLSTYFQLGVMQDLQSSAVSHLLDLSYRFYTNNFSGALVRKVGRLSRAFEDLADAIQWRFTRIAVQLIGILTILWLRFPLIGAILTAWVIGFLVINWLFSIWKLKYDEARAEIDSEVTGTLSDIVTNNQTVQLFTGKKSELKLFDLVVGKWKDISVFTWQLSEWNVTIQTFFMFALEFLFLYFGLKLWAAGEMTVGDFVMLQAFMMSIFDVLWDFGRVLRKAYESIADAAEMVEILNLEPEIQDVPGAKDLKVESGLIEFKNVTFSYGKGTGVLKAFNAEIKSGEKVALVGPSGAGKTTVTKLLFRFFDLSRGSILIDGQDIAEVTQESLRGQIALVPQEPILFHRSLFENIQYGRPGASKADVMAASKQAHCHEFISKMPKGYDTLVGERGVKLSGGERQRVAIARAILKNAPILVLDEATSSLDSESERLIQEALKHLMHGKTVIVIAHRLSTIRMMDRILVIEKGKVVSSGTHNELVERHGTYQKLWELQAGGFLK